MNIEAALKGLIVLATAMLLFVFATAWIQVPFASFFALESGLQFHLSFATVAVLLSLFSDTCILFYFIGTSVWMRDRSKEILRKDRAQALQSWQYYEKANKLKAKTFPFATMGIGLGLFTFVLGGARQVGAIPNWLHPTLAFIFLLNSLFAIKFYFRGIRENIVFLDRVSALLQAPAGLAVDAEANKINN